MIRNEDQFTIQRGGETSEVVFTIEADSAAFEALSADLYTDRVIAPIRELSANAADAHVAAGNTGVPFQIHAPTKLEPYFSVRDFGTGLSRKDIETLYTRYFHSTKTRSNDFIGCKGLGSKSPFAYVDSFTVVSRFGGKKMVFNCFKNENRCPATAFLGEEDCDEHPGLEVSFPVQNGDIWEFEGKIKAALQFYDKLPEVRGIVNFEVDEFEYLIKTKEFGIPIKRTNESLVIMGNIAYPFDSSSFDKTADALNSKENQLVEWGVHLFAPIGTVEVAISREKLTYTRSTRGTVKELLNKAVQATQEEAEKMLSSAQTIWDARCAVAKIKRGVLGEITDFNPEDLEWGGQAVDEKIDLTRLEVKPRVVEMLSRQRESGYRRRRHYHTGSVSRDDYFTHYQVHDFIATDLAAIFVNDMDHGGYASARRYMDENGIRKTVMFTDPPQEFIDSVGCGHLLIKTSTLPKPERKPRGSATRSERTTLQEWDDGEFTNVEKDLAEGGIYIEMRRDKIKWKADHWSDYGKEFVSASSINSTVSHMTRLGFNEKIYGIRPHDLVKLAKHGNWVSFEQSIKNLLKKNEGLLNELNLKATSDSMPSIYACAMDLMESLDDGCPVKEMIEIATAPTKTLSTKAQAFQSLMKHGTYEIQADESLVEKVNKIKSHYQLLESMDWRWEKQTADAVVEYIEFIDSKGEFNFEQEEAEAA